MVHNENENEKDETLRCARYNYLVKAGYVKKEKGR
jgi:hypothetical protein